MKKTQAVSNYIHNQKKSISVIITLCIYFFAVQPINAEKLDLSGKWTVKLDSTSVGMKEKWFLNEFTQTIQLPGTTDKAELGKPNTLKPELKMPQVLYLTRKNSYIGAAWYSRIIVIPANWKNRSVLLKLERVLWESRVWVDGIEVVGMQESLIAPHYYDLTTQLPPGSHKVVIRVDNRKKYDISVPGKTSPIGLAHAYSEETQTIWNGIIGEISCESFDRVRISDLQIFPNVDNKTAKMSIQLNKTDLKNFKGKISISVGAVGSNNTLPNKTIDVNFNEKSKTFELDFAMGNDVKLWSGLSPNLYKATALVSGLGVKIELSRQFGMRKLTNKNSAFQLNGENIFLRGTLECCIFPLTAYPAMDNAGWEKVFQTARNWGLNHLRFHSWCPPRYAFEVADKMGFYLQVELPYWSATVNQDTATSRFLYDEADRIIREYGNHPSFCFWSIGNELKSDFKFLNSFVDKLKAKDVRHLYCTTTYTFEKGHAWAEPSDDYYITQRTRKGWVRGQGVFGAVSPRFDKDFSAATDSLNVPLVEHEIGQYSVFPNLKEIDKYTGVLDPLNFKAIRDDLSRKGMLSKADDYLNASGKLAAILYKEEIERSLKTRGVSGFQMLDLHDFPGQGTATVGLLDAFWDSKGLIKPEEFRSFCSSIVPLARFGKPVFKNNETFKASVEIANYSEKAIANAKIIWELCDQAGKMLKTGTMPAIDLPNGKNTLVGKLSCELSTITNAQQLTLVVRTEQNSFSNSWKIWVYPSNLSINYGNITSKTSVGDYSYGTKPHAVTSVTNPAGLISTNDQRITYTVFNKADSIIQNNYKYTLIYGHQNQRTRSKLLNGSGTLLKTTYYVGPYEKEVAGTITKDIHYIYGGDGLAAILKRQSGTDTMYYVYKDHLGSLDKVTNSSGVVVQSTSFDAWGRRRNPTNWTYTSIPATNIWISLI